MTTLVKCPAKWGDLSSVHILHVMDQINFYVCIVSNFIQEV